MTSSIIIPPLIALLFLLLSSASSSSSVSASIDTSYCEERRFMGASLVGYGCDCSKAPNNKISIIGGNPDLETPVYIEVTLTGADCSVEIRDLIKPVSYIRIYPPKPTLENENDPNTPIKMANSISISSIKCHLPTGGVARLYDACVFFQGQFDAVAAKPYTDEFKYSVNHISLSNIVAKRLAVLEIVRKHSFSVISHQIPVADVNNYTVNNVSLDLQLSASPLSASTGSPFGTPEETPMLNVSSVEFLYETELHQGNTFSFSNINVGIFKLDQIDSGDIIPIQLNKEKFDSAIRGVTFRSAVVPTTVSSPNNNINMGFVFKNIHVYSRNFSLTNSKDPHHSVIGVGFDRSVTLTRETDVDHSRRTQPPSASQLWHSSINSTSISVSVENATILDGEFPRLPSVKRPLVAAALLFYSDVYNITHFNGIGHNVSVQSSFGLAESYSSVIVFVQQFAGIGFDETTPIQIVDCSSSLHLGNINNNDNFRSSSSGTFIQKYDGTTPLPGQYVNYDSNSTETYILRFEGDPPEPQLVTSRIFSPIIFARNSMSGKVENGVRDEFRLIALSTSSGTFSMNNDDLLFSSTAKLIVEENSIDVSDVYSLGFDVRMLHFRSSVVNLHTLTFSNNNTLRLRNLHLKDEFYNTQVPSRQVKNIVLSHLTIDSFDVGNSLVGYTPQSFQIVAVNIQGNYFDAFNCSFGDEAGFVLVMFQLLAPLGRNWQPSLISRSNNIPVSNEKFELLITGNKLIAEFVSGTTFGFDTLFLLAELATIVNIDSVSVHNNTFHANDSAGGYSFGLIVLTSVDGVRQNLSISENDIDIRYVAVESRTAYIRVITFHSQTNLLKTSFDRDNNEVFLLVQKNQVSIHSSSLTSASVGFIQLFGAVSTPNFYLTNNNVTQQISTRMTETDSVVDGIITNRFLTLNFINVTNTLRLSQNNITLVTLPSDWQTGAQCLSEVFKQFDPDTAEFSVFFNFVRGNTIIDNMNINIRSRCSDQNQITLFNWGRFMPRDVSGLPGSAPEGDHRPLSWISQHTFSDLRVSFFTEFGKVKVDFLTMASSGSTLRTDEFLLNNNAISFQGGNSQTSMEITLGLTLVLGAGFGNEIWIRRFVISNSNFTSFRVRAGDGAVELFLHRHATPVPRGFIGNFSHENINFAVDGVESISSNVKIVLVALAGDQAALDDDILDVAHLQFTMRNVKVLISDLYSSRTSSRIVLLSVGQIQPTNLPESKTFYNNTSDRLPKYFFSVRDSSIHFVNAIGPAEIVVGQTRDVLGAVYEVVNNEITGDFDQDRTYDYIQMSIFRTIEGMSLTRSISVVNNKIHHISSSISLFTSIVLFGGGISARHDGIFKLPFTMIGNVFDNITLAESLLTGMLLKSARMLVFGTDPSTSKMAENQGGSNGQFTIADNRMNLTSMNSCLTRDACELISCQAAGSNLSVDSWLIEKNQIFLTIPNDAVASSPSSSLLEPKYFNVFRSKSDTLQANNNSIIFRKNYILVKNEAGVDQGWYAQRYFQLAPVTPVICFPVFSGLRVSFECNYWDKRTFLFYFIGNYSQDISDSGGLLVIGARCASSSASQSISVSASKSISEIPAPVPSQTPTSSESSSVLPPDGDRTATPSHEETATPVKVYERTKSSSTSVSQQTPSNSHELSSSLTLPKSPSRSEQGSATQTYAKKPLPPPLQLDPFVGASTATAVGSIFSGNPAAYQLTQKVMLGAKLLNCGNGILEEKLQDATSEVKKGDVDAIEELSYENNPLGIKIGSEPLNSHRGSLISLVLACIIFAALLAIITYLYRSFRKLKTFQEAAKKIHHPGFNAVSLAIFAAAASFSVGIIAGSFGTDLSDGAATDMILLLVGILLLIIAPLVIFVKVFHRCHAKEKLKIVEKTDYFMIFDETTLTDDDDDDESADDGDNNNKKSKKKKNSSSNNKKDKKKKNKKDEYYDDEEMQTKNHFKNLTTSLKKQKDRERKIEEARVNKIVSEKIERNPNSPKILVFRILRYWIVPWLEWRTTTWVKLHAPFIDALKHPYYGLLEFGVPIIIGLASGYSTFCESVTCCRGLSLFSLVVAVIHIFCFFYFKPFMNRLDVVFGGFGCIATAIQCAFVTAGVFGVEWMTGVVEVVSQVVGSFGLVLILFTFLSYAPRMRKIVRMLCKNMVDKKGNGRKKNKNQPKKKNKEGRTKSLKKNPPSSDKKSVNNNKQNETPLKKNLQELENEIDKPLLGGDEPSLLGDLHQDEQKPNAISSSADDSNNNNTSQEGEGKEGGFSSSIEDDVELFQSNTITMTASDGQPFALQLEEVDYDEYFASDDDDDNFNYEEEEELEMEEFEDDDESFEGSEYQIDLLSGENENENDDDLEVDLEERCEDYSFAEIRNLLGGADDEEVEK